MTTTFFVLNSAYATEQYHQTASLSAGEGAFYNPKAGGAALGAALSATNAENIFIAREVNGLLHNSPIIKRSKIDSIAKVSPSSSGWGATITHAVGGGVINGAPVIVTAGTGYKVGDKLTVDYGPATTSAILTVTAVTSVGGISALAITHGGAAYIKADVAVNLLPLHNKTLGTDFAATVTTTAGQAITQTEWAADGVITAAGTNYQVGDIIAGRLAAATETVYVLFRVLTINAVGGVLTVEVATNGATYGAAVNVALVSTTMIPRLGNTINLALSTPITGREYQLVIKNRSYPDNEPGGDESYEVIAASAVTSALATALAGGTYTHATVTASGNNLIISGTSIYDDISVEIRGDSAGAKGSMGLDSVQTVLSKSSTETGTYRILKGYYDNYSTQKGRTKSGVYAEELDKGVSGLIDGAYFLYIVDYWETVTQPLMSENTMKPCQLLVAVLATAVVTGYDTAFA